MQATVLFQNASAKDEEGEENNRIELSSTTF